jgi:SAM-dependent methyltransferase
MAHVPERRRWLDVGSGTGALTATILEDCDPAEVVGVEPSDGYRAWAAEQVTDARARFVPGTAADLPDGPFDAAVSGLVLNFVPDAAGAVRAMGGAGSGGVVAAYVWDYAGRMELMRYFWDAAVALDPDAGALDEGVRFPICVPARLEQLWRDAGLANVSSRAIDVPTVFRDFDDQWRPFLGGQAPAPGYCMSLDEDRRAALREHIREQFPIAADGSISLIARAWAVRGDAPRPLPDQRCDASVWVRRWIGMVAGSPASTPSSPTIGMSVVPSAWNQSSDSQAH